MTSLCLIRSYVENRLPGALSPLLRAEPQMLRTGLDGLDRLTGGIPRRGLTQICAPKEVSSGRTTLLVSMMAEVTRAEEFCALVDASDCFDPASAEAAGVDLSRVLWVRCQRARGGIRPLEQAFRAADIVVQNGGFGLIVVDLGNIEERWVRKAPLSTWFRFARVMEKMPAALVFLVSYPAAQSCAALTLQLAGSRGRWRGDQKVFHANFLSGVECEFAIGRARNRPFTPAHPSRNERGTDGARKERAQMGAPLKPVQSVPGRFTAKPVWA